MRNNTAILAIEGSGRYRIHHFQTRFNTTEYMVLDAEAISDADIRAGKLPPVVFQTDNHTSALHFVSNN